MKTTAATLLIFEGICNEAEERVGSRVWLRRIALGFALLALPFPALAVPFFSGVGDLPGAAFFSGATVVSADGSTVWGTSATEGFFGNLPVLFRWTRAGGMEDIQLRAGCCSWFFARDTSADGSVVVGTSLQNSDVGFSWSESAGVRYLSGVWSGADAVSADGTTAVGGFEEATPGSPKHGALWREDGSRLVLEGMIRAQAISADGLTVLGRSGRDANTGLSEVVRWSASTGVVSLGFGVPGVRFVASPNLDFVAGSMWGPDEDNPGSLRNYLFRWDEQSGVELLEPGFDPRAISADGSLIFGEADGRAVMWDPANGARFLQDVLATTHGLDLTGWTLLIANDTSDDGRTIVGNGINPDGNAEGWIAVIPEPGSGALLALAVGSLGLVAKCFAVRAA